MKRNSYYPTNVPEQILWLTNFFNKLIGHAPALGVSAPVCAAAVADARWLIYLLGAFQPALKAWSKSCTDFVREAQNGTGEADMVLPAFTAPPLPPADAGAGLPAVVPVKPGALNRIFSLVQVMQESPAYVESLGTDLGTIGSEVTGPDFATLRPVFTLRVEGGKVVIDWTWGGFRSFLDMLQLQVDRADGKGFVDLAFDTTPGYSTRRRCPPPR